LDSEAAAVLALRPRGPAKRRRLGCVWLPMTGSCAKRDRASPISTASGGSLFRSIRSVAPFCDAGPIASAALAGASRRRCHPALHARVSADGPRRVDPLPVGRSPPLAARLGAGEARQRARAGCSPSGTRSACSRSCRRGYGTLAEHLTPLQGRGRLRNLNEHGAFAATARHRLSLVMKGSPVRVRASALRKRRKWPDCCDGDHAHTW
jgi:hypothetical protein